MDLRIENGRILNIDDGLAARAGEEIIDAAGGALFPGLHDHHIHLAAYAAAIDSVMCGPPAVGTAEELAHLLRRLNGESRTWIRGVGYHESVAGFIDRVFLDRLIPARPVRIQHRSGRLWILNTAAIEALRPSADDPLERRDGQFTGRLYDSDAWLRTRMGGRFPNLARASRELAKWGLTGITDATASNNLQTFALFERARENGELLQSVLVMGDDSLNGVRNSGPRKFHLHEAALPDFGETVAAIARAHEYQRPVAFHCVTRTDLSFALAALESAKSRPGDRVEHASIAPPEMVGLIRRLGVTVVTQPSFVFERGDSYLDDVEPEDVPWLYRVAGLSGIPVAAGTDAPFGTANPWLLMQAAIERKTRSGRILGLGERIAPESALALFLGDPEAPGGAVRRVAVGETADLILLDRSWRKARENLAELEISVTLKTGHAIFKA